MKKLLCFLLLVMFVSSTALADQVFEKKTKMLGKEFSVKERLGSVLSGNGVNQFTQIRFLGKLVPLLSSRVEFTTMDGKIENKTNELLVNGIKVWTGGGVLEDGKISYSGSVAPTQINIPAMSYTVGPLVLELNAGINFEASMEAGLSSPLLLPDSSTLPNVDSLVAASLKTDANASGYVEGLARVLVVQAGVGGSVNIVDGNASVMASIPMLDPLHPELTYDGKLQVLNGKIYAFVDYRKINGWKRWKEFNLYSWKGSCWSMGGQACGTLN